MKLPPVKWIQHISCVRMNHFFLFQEHGADSLNCNCDCRNECRIKRLRNCWNIRLDRFGSRSFSYSRLWFFRFQVRYNIFRKLKKEQKR